MPVEVVVAGHRLEGISQDVSQYGLFVRIPEVIAVGEPVELVLRANDVPLAATARVAHVLTPAEARSLGRQPGLGLTFDVGHGRFDQRLASLLAEQRLHPSGHGGSMRVVVADGATRLLERLSTALANAGFQVATATSGAEALAACLAQTPDLVIAAADMEVVDGFALVESLGARDRLAGVPVMLMSHDASDLRRLRAYRMGVKDFIPKPFTVAELCIRARRLARARRDDDERVLLRGSLAELSLPALFTTFERERKTGVLAVARDDEVAWISFRDGRPVKARTPESSLDARGIVMELLDWTTGDFELTAAHVDDDDEIGDSAMHLLLEHARRSDEARR